MSKLLAIGDVNLPAAWETAVVGCWKNGIDFKTEYDKPGDPPSKDITLALHVKRPMSEPRIHRAIPGGIEDLEMYRLEVVEGIHDNWIAPTEGKWSYTYHNSLVSYNCDILGSVNQLDYIVETLAKEQRSRRAQAILWDVERDAKLFTDHPPCLQRIWCRLDEINGNLFLDMHVNMRSNDAYKAAFMNMYAFTDLQRKITEQLAEKIGKYVGVGSYIHYVDSFHIYGSYFAEFEGFLKSIETRTFDERVYSTQEVQFIIDEVRGKNL